MFDHILNAEHSAKYWDSQSTDLPYTLNGFNGTWAFSDHRLIPEPIVNYLREVYYKYDQLSRVPLEDLNKSINEVWEGPGSMSKIARLTAEIRVKRQNDSNETSDPLKGYDTPTVDSDLGDSPEE